MNLPPLRMLFFEDLAVGMSERLSKTVASSDVVGFAQLTGDRNPIHLSEHFAAKTSFGRRIAHGLYSGKIPGAIVLHLRGRRRGGSGRRGAGEGPEQEGSQGKAATDAAVAARKQSTRRRAAADAHAEAC